MKLTNYSRVCKISIVPSRDHLYGVIILTNREKLFKINKYILTKKEFYKLLKNVRIETLDHKINKLQTRKKRLEAKKTSQLTKILNRCGADKISDEILAGVVLEAVKASQKNDSRVSTWESEGLKILKPGRGRKKFI